MFILFPEFHVLEKKQVQQKAESQFYFAFEIYPNDFSTDFTPSP